LRSPEATDWEEHSRLVQSQGSAQKLQEAVTTEAIDRVKELLTED
jgi:hypothetical protein